MAKEVAALIISSKTDQEAPKEREGSLLNVCLDGFSPYCFCVSWNDHHV